MKRLILFSLFFMFAILSIELVSAKSYSYSYINIVLNIEKNGTIFVSQERAYDFSGSFSWAYLDLEKKGSSDIDFIEIRDLDTNTELPYDIEEDGEHIKATWHYNAYNEVKKFLIIYRIDGAIKRYEDVADLYWKVIEDSHERIDKLNVEINLPSPSPNLFKVFVHSSASPGELNFFNDLKEAYVNMQNIPVNTFVEFRVLTEPDIYNIQEIPSEAYEKILNEEKDIFYNPFVQSISFNIWFYVLPVIFPFIIFILFYFKYGREPKVEYNTTYEHEPPHKIPPMALANLIEGEETQMNIRLDAMGLLATLFDLARRGYLEIREEKRERFLGLGERTEQIFVLTEKGKRELKSHKSLEDFEIDILSFIFNCGSEPNMVSSSEITNYCRKHSFGVRDDIEKIDEKARDWFEKNIFKINEKINSEKRRIFELGMGFYVLIFFLYWFISRGFRNYPLILVVIVSSIVAFFAGHTISKRTYNSALEVKKWKAFKKFLSDFSAMKDAPATLLHIWDEYLVYAIVLGVATKLLENIKKLSLERNQPIVAVGWYHGITPTPTGTISPEAITGFINNMSHTINALSSSTSVGGGFSGGGGGGGGGGGSGAG